MGKKYLECISKYFYLTNVPTTPIFVGCDGWIRVWDLESICNAKASDSDSDKAIFHLDPMNEVEVEGICFYLQLLLLFVYIPSAVYLLSFYLLFSF